MAWQGLELHWLLLLVLFNYEELPHHALVLVFQDVAVIHIGNLLINKVGKAHDNAYPLSRAHLHRIFPAHLIGRWLPSVAVQNLELAVVYMERVHHGGVVG